MLYARIKRVLIGRPLTRLLDAPAPLPKWKALAVLASDALSSVAYATEEILIPLAAFGAAALAWSIPIAMAITGLLVIITISYRQTIDAYPQGGGAYTVAKENLGVRIGLWAGAALLIDYVLTVAVSVAAGTENIVAAFPALTGYKEAIGISVILVLMVIELRGIQENVTLFSLPTYFFILSIVALLVTGFWKIATGQFVPVAPVLHEVYPVLPLFLILKSFSSGCAALAGVEAISDGLQEFEPPQQKNARITLLWMCMILGSFFLGITFLTHMYGIRPSHAETSVSALAHAVFGSTGMYYFVQISTAVILLLAANTSYTDFPKLASFLAKDRFLPRQLAIQGDRLVFSNGVIGLSLTAAALIYFFEGSTHHLIPLYAIGVFLSFTLSQFGMVKHHLRVRGNRWTYSAAISAIGGVTTCLVFLVLTATKFLHGAWAVFLMMGFLVFIFTRINRHYLAVGKELSLTGEIAPKEALHGYKHTVLIPVSGVHRGVIKAMRYAISISDDVRACYVEIDEETTERVKIEWERWMKEIPFIVLKSPYRSVVAPLLRYIDEIEEKTPGVVLTVVIPEFVTAKWWHQILHNQTALLIRTALIFRKRKVVTSVRYHLKGV